MITTLYELTAGQSATVQQMTGLDQALARRLYALGFLPQHRITLLRHTPLKDLVQVECNAMRLALTASLAKKITVHVEHLA